MKIRYGVIGCNGIAYRRTIKGIIESDNSTLEIVFGNNEEKCKKVSKEFGVKYTTDIDELLKADIDAVYIATPVYSHLEEVRKAAKAKKHILLEKPYGLNSEEAREIINICKNENVFLDVGFMMRYHNQHKKIKKIIENGEIGKIVSFRAQFSCLYPEIDGAWRQNKKLSGGGALMDLGTHCIDILNYILQIKVKSVFAFCSSQTFSYEVEDSASLLIKTENDAIGHIDINFNIPDDANQSKLEFYGTKGSIISYGTLGQSESGITNVTISENINKYDSMQNQDKVNSYTLSDNGGNLYMREITHFSNCIIKNNMNISNDALFAQIICDCAYESSKTDKSIEFKNFHY